MKITTISVTVCLVLSFAACSRLTRTESTNPKKDVIGKWERRTKAGNFDLVELQLKENGGCWYRQTIDPPSGNPCTYLLSDESSGRFLQVTRNPDTMLRSPARLYKWKVQVYENELVVDGSSLTRVKE